MTATQPQKLSILPGHPDDYSACTFVLLQEDHTLGNTLRYMLMKDPRVEFCGYSLPHPSEDKLHLRIQTYDGVNAIDTLIQACKNLEAMTEAIEAKYTESLEKEEYEKVEEDDPVIDWDTVKAKAKKSREAKAQEEKRKEQAAAARR